MTSGEIQQALPSIALAHLFYEYGKLDAMIKEGYNEPGDEFCAYFLDLLYITADFVHEDYVDDYDVARWYFSDRAMVEYYRLCRTYGCAHGLKLKDNPYMREAERFVESAMDLGNSYGYGWYLNTKVGHEWASGIVFRTDCYFDGEMELLEALLSIRQWFEVGVQRLRKKLAEEQQQAAPRYMEVMAA